MHVFCGKVGEAVERLYVYEGLYLVAPSKDGPQVRQNAFVCNCKPACVRGEVGGAGERPYVYEGLYTVAVHKREPSKDGPQV